VSGNQTRFAFDTPMPVPMLDSYNNILRWWYVDLHLCTGSSVGSPPAAHLIIDISKIGVGDLVGALLACCTRGHLQSHLSILASASTLQLYPLRRGPSDAFPLRDAGKELLQ